MVASELRNLIDSQFRAIEEKRVRYKISKRVLYEHSTTFLSSLVMELAAETAAPRDTATEKFAATLKSDVAALLREAPGTPKNIVVALAVSYAMMMKAIEKHEQGTSDYEKEASSLVTAAYFLGLADGSTGNDVISAEMRARIQRESGLNAVMAKLKRDPKQLAMQKIREYWWHWYNHPGAYKSKAEFARAMLSKYDCYNDEEPLLKSAPNIERWCRKWEKEALSARSTH